MVDLTLLLLTWNVMETPPSLEFGDFLSHFLKPSSGYVNPQFIAIGFQEVKFPSLQSEPWADQTKQALREHDFVIIKKIRLVGIFLILLARRNLIPRIRNVRATYVRTGLGGYWGNKGAVSIRFEIDEQSIVIINSHLSAHDYNLNKRIKEYFTISSGLNFVIHPLQTVSLEDHDLIVWLGDLNFRLDDINMEEVMSNINTANITEKSMKPVEYLLGYDQLKIARRTARAFEEYYEPDISFLPSYKFRPNTDDYDISRKPAWCDRILHRIGPRSFTTRIAAEKYLMHIKLKQSDHKPVSQVINFTTSSSNRNRRSVKFARPAGWRSHRDSVAYFTSVASEADFSTQRQHVESLSTSVENSDSLSAFDWIGLYPEDFTDLDDPFTYVWVDPDPLSELQSRAMPLLETFTNSPSTSQQCFENQSRNVHFTPWYKVEFPDLVLLRPGRFRLLYFNDNNDVLAMSDPFEIKP